MPENQSPDVVEPIATSEMSKTESGIATTSFVAETKEKKEAEIPAAQKIPLEEKFFVSPTPAQNTFGRRVTQEEVAHKEKVREILEKVWWLLVVGVVTLILWASWPKFKAFLDLLTEHSTLEQNSAPGVMEVTSQVVTPILSGSIYRLNQDLGYLNSNAFAEINYYAAGTFTSGKYAGGERFIVVARRHDGTVMSYTFVHTASGEVFLAGGKPNPAQWLKTLQSYYLLDEINQNSQTIQIVDEIETDHPQTLPISKTMILYRVGLLTQVGPYPGEAEMSQLNLNLDFQEYHNLSLLAAQNYSSLKIYDKGYSLEELFNQVRSNLESTAEAALDTYLNSGTRFVVLDKVGVPVVYELAFVDHYQNYQQDTLTKELFALSLYQQELIKYKATSQYQAYRQHAVASASAQLPEDGPTAPTVGLNLPGFVYPLTDFELDSDLATVFDRFGPALLSSCTQQTTTKVMQNLTLADLKPVGKIFIPQATLYRLADEQHPLFTLAYEAKFVNTGLTDEEIVAQNQDVIVPMKPYTQSELSQIRNGRLKVTLPTLAEYAQQMPLLFVLDPWGRIVMLQESTVVSDPACIVEQDVV